MLVFHGSGEIAANPCFLFPMNHYLKHLSAIGDAVGYTFTAMLLDQVNPRTGKRGKKFYGGFFFFLFELASLISFSESSFFYVKPKLPAHVHGL